MVEKPTAPPEPSPWSSPQGQGPAAQGWYGPQQQQLPHLTPLLVQGTASPPQVAVPQHMVPQRQVYVYKAQSATILGWILIACGILSIICNIVGIVYGHELFYLSSGMFSGILYIPAGVLTLQAAKRKTKYTFIGSLVLSIIAAVVSWYQIGCSLAVVIVNHLDYYMHYLNQRDVSLAMGSLLLILGIAAFVTAVWASALACAVVCCGATINSATPVTLRYATYPQQPQVVVPGQPQVVQGLQAGIAPQAQPGEFQVAPLGPPPAYASLGEGV